MRLMRSIGMAAVATLRPGVALPVICVSRGVLKYSATASSVRPVCSMACWATILAMPAAAFACWRASRAIFHSVAPSPPVLPAAALRRLPGFIAQIAV